MCWKKLALAYRSDDQSYTVEAVVVKKETKAVHSTDGHNVIDVYTLEYTAAALACDDKQQVRRVYQKDYTWRADCAKNPHWPIADRLHTPTVPFRVLCDYPASGHAIKAWLQDNLFDVPSPWNCIGPTTVVIAALCVSTLVIVFGDKTLAVALAFSAPGALLLGAGGVHLSKFDIRESAKLVRLVAATDTEEGRDEPATLDGIPTIDD
jgi:hypothetical protein